MESWLLRNVGFLSFAFTVLCFDQKKMVFTNSQTAKNISILHAYENPQT